jgi:hypothetical protein
VAQASIRAGSWKNQSRASCRAARNAKRWQSEHDMALKLLE